MWVLRGIGDRVRVCVAGARALRAVGVAALALAFGCAERTPTTPSEAPCHRRGDRDRRGAVAATGYRPRLPASLRPRTPLPAPVAMPGGGTCIDLRGSGRHVRALERQPDGTFKHVCVDAPEMLAPAGGSR